MHRRLTLFLALLLAFAGCSKFDSQDAATKIRFRVGASEGGADRAADLALVQRAIEHRLRDSGIVDGFVVETNVNGELSILTGTVTPDQLAVIQDLATRPGTIEFALLANPRDHAQAIAAATAEDATDQSARLTAWIPLEAGPDGRPIELGDEGDPVTREVERDGKAWKEVLILRAAQGSRIATGSLVSVEAATDPSGNPALQFRLNLQGGLLMNALTSGAQPAPDGFRRRLAILLDGRLHSAPSIMAPVGARGIIGGDFSKEDAERLAVVLSSGALAAPVEFVEVQDLQPSQ